HWMDAMTPPLRARIDELADTVGRLVGGPDVPGARELDDELSSMSRRDPEGFGLVRGVMRGMQTGDWCTVRKRPEEGDYLQTCKLCGWSDWFEPGLTPARCCGDCGLSEDPGEARKWFEFVEKGSSESWTGYGEKPSKPIVVSCNECGESTTYSFKDGPP